MSAKNRGAKVTPFEAYNTPSWCVRAFLNDLHKNGINLSGSILEPCSGQFAITLEMLHYFDDNWEELVTYINCIDIQDFSHEEVNLPQSAPVFYTQADYLTASKTQEYDFIITNPPFSLAVPFLEFLENLF